jgi:GTP-binding protein Era
MFCVVNKVDLMSKDEIAVALSACAAIHDFEEFVPVSARTGQGLETLRDLVIRRLPEGPMYYPAGASTDQPPPVFVAELVREKLLQRSREELPHSIAVVTEDYGTRPDGLLEITARIFVERESQKAIVIGRHGAMLKAVGRQARREIEALFGTRVYLDLRVKVERDWQRREHALERLGFGS